MAEQMSVRLWVIGPRVVRAYPGGSTHWVHGQPHLHRAFIEQIGGIGEPNAGEFLIETPCGYRGWVRHLNKNPNGHAACEQCLNERPSPWRVWPLPEGAVLVQGETEEARGV